MTRIQLGELIFNHINFLYLEDMIKIRDRINQLLLAEAERQSAVKVTRTDWSNPRAWIDK